MEVAADGGVAPGVGNQQNGTRALNSSPLLCIPAIVADAFAVVSYVSSRRCTQVNGVLLLDVEGGPGGVCVLSGDETDLRLDGAKILVSISPTWMPFVCGLVAAAQRSSVWPATAATSSKPSLIVS